MASERETIMNALLSGVEPSGELEKRFKTQVDSILHRRLPTYMRVIGIVQAVIFTVAGLGMAYGAISMTAAGEARGSALGTFQAVSFGITALLFFAFALFVGRQAASGYQAPRRWGRLAVTASIMFCWLFTFAIIDLAPRLKLSPTGMTWWLFFASFAWITAWSLQIFFSQQWHHDDAMLEQKRTQLEIALLREALAGKSAE